MNKEDLRDLKEQYLNRVLDTAKEHGSALNHIAVLGKHKVFSDRPSVVQIPLGPDQMGSAEAKDRFMEIGLPSIASKVREDFDVSAVAWSAEAWMRQLDKEQDPDDYESIPISGEVLIIHYEDDDHKENHLYNIKRVGKKVNEMGHLIDEIELEVHTISSTNDNSGTFSSGGRFDNILPYFRD